MAGYVPLFDSLTKGTLCGRWPDIGLWPIVLSLSDKHGVVDVTPIHIAGVTGLSVEDVAACMRRFCEPDPYSRSRAADGARLVLLDDHRDWGWQIVNHSSYREKARKAAFDAQRVESGENKKRMAERPAMTRDDPTPPAESGADPPSDANANADSVVVVRAKQELSKATEMAVALRKLDVNVTSTHPTLVSWVQSGRTVAEVCEAVEVARKNPGKETGSLAPNYIHRILTEPRAPPGPKRGNGAWARMEAELGDD